jgi:sulfate permease, SulP family
VNASAGARSQLSGLIVAAMTVVTLLLLTGLFEDLPEATLAAVVIAALVELVDFSSLIALRRYYTRRLGEIYGPAARADFLAAFAAMAGVLLFDTLPGLFIGIGVSFVLLLYRLSRPHVARLGRVPGTTDQFVDLAHDPDAQSVTGVAVLRVEGGLFFANAENVRDAVRAAAAERGTRAVVLDAETVPFVDVTAARMLDDIAGDLDQRGVRLVLAHDIGQVRDVLAQGEGRLRVYPTVRLALDALA